VVDRRGTIASKIECSSSSTDNERGLIVISFTEVENIARIRYQKVSI
jgi:hypothetical protein